MNGERGGLRTVTLTASDGARAEVATHGAHVLSWQAAGDARERLFLSERTELRAGVAIRGGIPVIFPQFATSGPLPRHGFARTLPWTLVDAGATDGGRTRATLRLGHTEVTQAIWPHRFVAELTVTIGGATLEVALAVTNADAAPLSFTAALHTYLRVADVARAALHGLRGLRYRDSTAGGAERVDRDDALTVPGEVDRIYLDVPTALELRDAGAPALTVDMDGFRDVVVWNPGAERAAALSDLELGGWSRFLCVEAAVVAEPVVLAPGAHWRGAQTLTAR
ncbi:D-hexose-6-phosphate mutarotase [Roseisolibacter agri]|uniref:Putative glucose-6-phosphate 1-epimerase n=1 Tax=Roseisolibacter agri TaxID=2014610 RepID=A0AA37Q2B3_9BACT|nr:D-hexose-6-phosphate mutarotase [Roseisolibacter agri]GLC25295.1 D-hexose-6-phosphate mutarotase [Roseisolibacter agri]